MDYDTTHDEQMLEKLSLLMAQPETLTPEEVETLMADPAFADLYRQALDIRRAQLEQADVPSAEEAFDSLMQQHEPVATHRYATVRWIAALMAAAAAVALLFVMTHHGDTTDVPATASNTSQLYCACAEQTLDDIVVTAGDKTARIGALHNTPATAQPQSIIVNVGSVQSIALSFDNSKIERSTLLVPHGKVARLELPDGSVVWLNARSSLIYPNSFIDGKPRHVKLSGEAYFQVKRDEKRPFLVECGGMVTKVLGTEFNIRGYAGQQPIVTLASGSVSVETGHSIETLTPGQQAALSTNGRLTITQADLKAATCWREGLFYFDGQPLRDIMVEIGRWYNMDVVVADAEHTADRLHFNGERQWTVYELIEQMNMICNTHVAIEDNTLKIY